VRSSLGRQQESWGENDSPKRQMANEPKSRQIERRIATATCWSIAVGLFSCIAAIAGQQADDKSLRATIEVIRQTYCPGDSDLFRVDLKLRLRLQNTTDGTLIVDKGIGTTGYQVAVAHNEADLVQGKFEYKPNAYWVSSDLSEQQKKVIPKAPDVSFAILASGQSFETEIDSGVFAKHARAQTVTGAIPSGEHVFKWNSQHGLGLESLSSFERLGKHTVNSSPESSKPIL